MRLEHMTNDDLIELRRELQRRGLASTAWPWEVGQAILIRSVTYHWVGRLAEIGPDYLLLEEASWVADSGRFGQAIASGFSQQAEVEYVGKALVMRAGIIDAVPWAHALPTKSQ